MVASRISYVQVAALLVVFGLGVSRAGAQPTPPDSAEVDTSRVQWTTSLPPLTVTASRIPTSPAEAPSQITVIDSATIHSGGAVSLATVLQDRAGLYVRRYGTGGLATPALRGTGASQTVLLLDGQRISDPQLGHLDLSLLPSVLLQSVTVMHGPASPVHGSNGLGGAIHLRSVQPRGPLRTRLTSQVGAFGTRRANLLVSGTPVGNTSALMAVDFETTDGDFPYTDTGQFPPKTVRRRNADRTQSTVYGSIHSNVGNHNLRVSGWLTRSERGLPGVGGGGARKERQWDRQIRLWGQDRLPISRGSLTVQGLAQRTRLRYSNPAQNIEQTGRTGLASLDVTLQREVSPQWTVVGGTSGSYARARHPKLDAAAHQHHLSAFTEGTGRYGRITLFPALRTDAYWMPRGKQRTAVNPRLGSNVQPLASKPALRLKAQFGRSFRVPTFNDRYWQPGGNPDLRPERSWGGDIGIRFDHPTGHAEVTAFGHWRRDQIVWRPTGDGYWSPRNVGRVRALGAEGSVAESWPLTSETDVTANLTYTLTDARNRSDPGSSSFGERILYVPRTQLKGHSTLTWGPASFSITARYTGRRPITRDGSRYRDPFVLLDTQVRIEQDFDVVRTELAVRVENTLNTNYRSVGGRPMPPRHLEVRLLVAP